MLRQIFNRQSMLYCYRLVKPNISEFRSIQQLQYDRKQRQLMMIQEQNNKVLNRNKLYTKQVMINQILNTSQQISQSILKRHLNFTTISPQSLKHYTLQQSYNDNKVEYPFLLQQVQSQLPQLNAIPMHFSYKRGVPIINQYQLDKKIAYVFNLPQYFNTKQVSQKLGIQTIKQIKVQYCRLGLPAYAKVYFNSDQAVTNLVLNNKTYVQIGGRVCFIKTHFDKQKLQLKNRRLVIHDLQSNQQDLIFQLSKYGRVSHLDYPTFISRNPSLQQVREKYKNSDQLIKINHHRKDGSIDYQYYPSLQQSLKLNTMGTLQDFEANIIQKKQKLQAMYKNRMRYAQQMNVYEGRQNQISIKNMGYCIVTYSCTQQAQNCYFNMRYSNKIQLYDSKNMQQFEIDEQYRKRILRFIDSQYQKTKYILENNQSIYEKQYQQYFDQLGLFDKLIDLQQKRKILIEKANDYNDAQPQVIIAYFNTRVNQIKKNILKKLGTKSFDQLAEKQLFGRVLPKHQTTKPKLSLDILPQTSQEIQQLAHQKIIDQISTKSIKARDNFYRKKKVRQIKRMGLNQVPAQQQLDAALGQQGQAQIQQDVNPQDFTGQRNFSTIKKRTISFRNRSSLELANYILRYCQYIRTIINQYSGIFPQSRFSYSTSPTFLNPQGLAFSDSTPYLTQQDLPKFLQCMRTFNDSQNIFTQFWKNYQFFKSTNININQYKFNVKNKLYQGLRKYYDTGSVKQIYQVEQGQDINKKILTLNATVASFGEQFKSHIDSNGNQVILKISKIQNICPLDRVSKISQAKAKFDSQNQVTKRQQQLFQQYKYQIIETGQIPAEIRKQFNIPQSKTLDDLFEELAADAGIYKKDIEMLLNLENFTEDQIAQDVGLQLELEKVRIAQKESNVNDYAKDPSNIEVRDKEGYFKVSKFRQI